MPNFFPMDFSKQMERIGSSGARAYQNMLNRKTAAEDRAMAKEDRLLDRRYKEQQISTMQGDTAAKQQQEDQKTLEQNMVLISAAAKTATTPDEVDMTIKLAKERGMSPQHIAFLENSRPGPNATSAQVFKWGTDVAGVFQARKAASEGKPVKYYDSSGNLQGTMTEDRFALGQKRNAIPKDWMLETGPKMDAFKAKQEDDRDSGGSWGQPKEGILNKPGDPLNGTPITYLTDKDGKVKILEGITPKMKKGMKFNIGPDGAVTFESGGDDMTVRSKGEIEGKIMKGEDALVRIKGIVETWDPRFNEVPSRFAAWVTAKKSKFVPSIERTKEEDEFLVSYSVAKRRALDNINRYIKDITGAQMSEKEADRLRQAVPDPGEGLFDGDAPPVFKSKLDDIQLLSEASLARYRYYLKNGLTPAQITVMNDEETSVSLDEIIARKKAKK